MKFIPLIFKKLGNHWYLDIPHDKPSDLEMDPKIDRFINRLDLSNDGTIDRVHLIEQPDFIDSEGLIQFSDSDLLRYFTTNDSFMMNVYINNHLFQISSKLYSLLEAKYKLDFHLLVYKVAIL